MDIKACYRFASTSLILATCLASAPPVVSALPTQDQASELPRKIEKTLQNEVFPAMANGNDQLFYESLAKIIRSATPERMEAIELFAKANNVDSPSNHFVNVKLMQIEQGFGIGKKKQNLKETVFLIGGINRRLQGFVDELENHQIMQDPLEVPEYWKDSRDLFWEVHVFKNEFANNFRLIDYGVATLMPHKKSILRSTESNPLETARKFESLAGQLPAIRRDLIEREAELRLNRFQSAYDKFFSAGDFETRLIAAMSIELDAEVLTPLLSSMPVGSFKRQKLNEPRLAETLAEKIHNARGQDKDVTTKARLFREGMHWWLRGRYGHASMSDGMLKPPAAMNNPEVMNALYMPKNRPKHIALDDADVEGTPGYERRHYYTWAVEYRPLISAYTREKVSDSRTRLVSTGKKRKLNNEEFFR